MPQAPPVLEGKIISGERILPVEVRYASKYSIWVELDGGTAGSDAPSLELKVGEDFVIIGACRVVDDPQAPNGAKRLLSIDRIYDFKKLFFRSEIVTLESASANMSIVRAYKEKIDPRFKDFVSSLTYDLSVYSNMLDQLDIEAGDEPELVREHVEERVLSGVGSSLTAFMEEALARLEEIVRDFSEIEHEHHGYYFRRQIWHVLLRAPIMARTNLKPRGYSGDSEMMRMVYANDYMGDSTFGKILHRFSIRQPAAQAVRNRRHAVPDMIRACSAGFTDVKPGRFRILSVACGPAVEMQDVLSTAQDCKRFHYSLLDQDQQALFEAGNLVKAIEESLHTDVSADLIRESVRTMLITEQLKERWGLFHFIYSMGLFDYLTAPVAEAVIKKLYQLLIPGGEMVIGNMHAGNPSRFFMEYWHDWKIIHRTEDDLLRLASDLEGAELSIGFDETRIQMVLRVRSQALSRKRAGTGGRIPRPG